MSTEVWREPESHGSRTLVLRSAFHSYPPTCRSWGTGSRFVIFSCLYDPVNLSGMTRCSEVRSASLFQAESPASVTPPNTKPTRSPFQETPLRIEFRLPSIKAKADQVSFEAMSSAGGG